MYLHNQFTLFWIEVVAAENLLPAAIVQNSAGATAVQESATRRSGGRRSRDDDVLDLRLTRPDEILVAVVVFSDQRDPTTRVARWQNLIPSFPWIAPGWRAWGRNPRKGRDQILQRSVAEP